MRECFDTAILSRTTSRFVTRFHLVKSHRDPLSLHYWNSTFVFIANNFVSSSQNAKMEKFIGWLAPAKFASLLQKLSDVEVLFVATSSKTRLALFFLLDTFNSVHLDTISSFGQLKLLSCCFVNVFNKCARNLLNFIGALSHGLPF